MFGYFFVYESNFGKQQFFEKQNRLSYTKKKRLKHLSQHALRHFLLGTLGYFDPKNLTQ